MPAAARIAPVVATAATLLATLGGVAIGAEFDHAAVARQALERHIRPGYQRFASATRELEGAMAPYCRQPTPETRRKVERAFDGAVSAWGHVEHIAFGPVTQGERLERIMFWPDRRGIAARQLAAVLRTRDPRLLDPKNLGERSVALQGLPVLDVLLFAEADASKDAEARSYRCAFAAAASANLARLAREIAAEWEEGSAYARAWLVPGPGNASYLKASETTYALAKALDLGMEKGRAHRVGGPLGLNARRGKIPAVLGKSRRTMRLILADIEGLIELYVEGGLEQAITAAGSDTDDGIATLAELVAAELRTARKGAAELVGAPSLFSAPASVQRVIALGFPLKNARATAATILAATAKLPLGFNATDGD